MPGGWAMESPLSRYGDEIVLFKVILSRNEGDVKFIDLKISIKNFDKGITVHSILPKAGKRLSSAG